ncbi:acyltransferase [Dyella koreensis]|uniref:Acyltransferase n=1 Tax=Dyella koreensis TaxID=311235 RepID=A0ABW8K9B9_9GAMM
MLDLLARCISGSVDWAQRRSHARRLRGYPGIAAGASVGVGSKLIGPKENFHIGAHSYLNQAHLSCGPGSRVVIGNGCAIGYNVSIKAITHHMDKPTRNAAGPMWHVERDIVIGDDCWIGDNVFIREGVVLGDNTIVGANSVVTQSFPGNQVIAGIPARVIRER